MNRGRKTDALVVTVLVVILLGLFVVLRLRQTDPAPSQPAEQENDIAPAGEMTRDESRQDDTDDEAGKSSDSAQAATEMEHPGNGTPGEEENSGQDEPRGWVQRAPAEFSEAELANCGRGVMIDLGRYNVGKGQQFEVGVALEGPALESCTLVVDYDPEVLQVVPNSAKPVSRQFRGGIECYADEAAGRLILIQSGVPGQKNLDAMSNGGGSVVWRMSALRSGTTVLGIADETSFTNGCGEEEDYRIAGGEIVVR